jgi:hypothetical protein
VTTRENGFYHLLTSALFLRRPPACIIPLGILRNMFLRNVEYKWQGKSGLKLDTIYSYDAPTYSVPFVLVLKCRVHPVHRTKCGLQIHYSDLT